MHLIAFFTAYWRSFAAAIAAAIFLAISNAFGMGGIAFHLRVLYWVPTMLAGTVIGQFLGLRMARRPRIGENTFVFWGMITLPITIVMTFICWEYFRLIVGAAPGVSFLDFFALVGLVSGAATAIMIMINRPGPATHAAVPDAQSVPVRFLERIPGKLTGGAIYAVQSEDHYLRIRTSKGSDLILMRLTDAIGELEGIEGAQTHRSWWVAKDGIDKVKRADGRVTLVLKDGAEAPVSRPNVRALRDSGWI
jgi:hypothetical protein